MSDELIACWAALVAYVDDIHQPQYNLTKPQWTAAQRLLGALNVSADLAGEDLVLFNALATMLDELDAPDMDDEAWQLAERMRTEYTAKVEAS